MKHKNNLYRKQGAPGGNDDNQSNIIYNVIF